VAVLTCPEMDGPALRQLSWELEDTHADLIVPPALIDVAGPRIVIRPAFGLLLLHVEEPELRGGRRVARQLADCVIGLVAVALLTPVMAMIAAA
jgi:hypothetical protein